MSSTPPNPPADVRELIKRLEGAAGPDRHLDWEIHLRDGLWGVGMYGSHPSYTASIDAALTLVPYDWDWLIRTGRRADGDRRPYAHLWPADKRAQGIEGTAQSPALALCIAALRARLES